MSRKRKHKKAGIMTTDKNSDELLDLIAEHDKRLSDIETTLVTLTVSKPERTGFKRLLALIGF